MILGCSYGVHQMWPVFTRPDLAGLPMFSSELPYVFFKVSPSDWAKEDAEKVAAAIATWTEPSAPDRYASGETPAVGDDVHVIGMPEITYTVRAVIPPNNRTRVVVLALGTHVASGFVLVKEAPWAAQR